MMVSQCFPLLECECFCSTLTYLCALSVLWAETILDGLLQAFFKYSALWLSKYSPAK